MDMQSVQTFLSTTATEVALKIFSAESMSAPEARERFFREARVGSEIKHPNVVRIREATPRGSSVSAGRPIRENT